MIPKDVSKVIGEAKQFGSFKLEIVLSPQAEMRRVGHLLSMVKGGHVTIDDETKRRLDQAVIDRRFSDDNARRVIATIADHFVEEAFVPLLGPAIEHMRAIPLQRTF